MNLRKVPSQASYQPAAEILRLHFKTLGCPGPKTFLQQAKTTVHYNKGQQSTGQEQEPKYMGVEIITHKAKERFIVQLEIKGLLKKSGGRMFSCFLLCCVQPFK